MPFFNLTITDLNGNPIPHGPTDPVTCAIAQQVITDSVVAPGPVIIEPNQLPKNLVDGSWICGSTGGSVDCTKGNVMIYVQYR